MCVCDLKNDEKLMKINNKYKQRNRKRIKNKKMEAIFEVVVLL
jgi:hypothetical protein